MPSGHVGTETESLTTTPYSHRASQMACWGSGCVPGGLGQVMMGAVHCEPLCLWTRFVPLGSIDNSDGPGNPPKGSMSVCTGWARMSKC